MDNPKVYGIHGEERILCQSCAERLYGDSLEMYSSAGEIQNISVNDYPTYAGKGLLCDDCWNWIFPPDRTEDPWWLVEPDSEEHLRLLAPFADYLESLQIDTMSLSNLLLSNVGNLVYAIYVFRLPPGPIWFLHSFYLVSTGLMLVWYLRYEGLPRQLQSFGELITTRSLSSLCCSPAR